MTTVKASKMNCPYHPQRALSLQRRLNAFVCFYLLLGRSCLSYTVSGIQCHQVKLQQNDDNSPFCLAASSAMDVMNHDIKPPINFLASQVWPSARVAALALQKHLEKDWTICELGCGPGLPSLTAAKLGAKRVYATDLDKFALQLVEKASQEQGLEDIVSTQQIDLTAAAHSEDSVPNADLYLLSDVFESSHVARGAADISRFILSNSPTAKIWVFAQSDRACREDYLKEIRLVLKDPSLDWTPLDQYDESSKQRIFLCDLDETKVSY